VKPPRRVRAFDALMKRTGSKITDAPTVADVRGLRARRQKTGDSPVGVLLQPLLHGLFGRPRPDVAIEERHIPLDGEQLRVWLYRPVDLPSDAPLVVHLHGGGWVLGDIEDGRPICSSVAEDAGVLVASVDYRLAPEHPAPTAVEDAIAATRWLAEHAGDLGATGPLGVVGDSAGGNLAALVAIAGRDGRGPEIAAQALVYPAVDLTMSFPSARTMTDAPILNRADMLAFRRHYLGHGEGTDDPALSPWHVDDLAGLPPALVQIAEHDPLRDEGRAYAARLADAGVPTRITDYVGMPHGFATLPGISGPSAIQAVAEISQFLAAHLRGSSG
jgi:acetyl esterase/lipase